jgi:N-acylneuraminate cytidylyltransferase/CMP-N,N'-diacetyllegionaminic acid synthase
MAILQARLSSYFTTIAVSTDDEEILENALKFGADMIIKRPNELTEENSGKPDTILHALEETEKKLGIVYDVVVDLDVTSPLRNIDDIKGAIDLLEHNRVASVISACKSHRNPYFNMLEVDSFGKTFISKKVDPPYLSRQAAPKSFDMNAAVHAWRADALKHNPIVIYNDSLIYEMPEERSRDIDTKLDFEIVKFLSKLGEV